MSATSTQVLILSATMSTSAFLGFIGGAFYTDQIKTPIKEHHYTEKQIEVNKPAALASSLDLAKIDSLLLDCKEMGIQQKCSEDAIEFLESKEVTEVKAQKIISSLQYQMLFKAAQAEKDESKENIKVSVDVSSKAKKGK